MSANTSEPRYAIYFVPDPRSELYRFGASVLGYDAYTGDETPFTTGAALDWSDKVREPRSYGFHATLKPPFRLSANVNFEDLKTELSAFAGSYRSIEVGQLEVRTLGSFIALVPETPRAAIDQLAGNCVRYFDRFRAPMTELERARRLTAPLTDRQKAYLDRWGYPYVFDDFQFHLTLTGPLVDDERAKTQQWLKAEFASRPIDQHLYLDRLVISRQAGRSFYVVHAAPVG